MHDLNAHPKSLLTTGNPKTAKGEGFGYLTAILHLAPHKLSGRNVCSHASAGCAAACLNTAGRGGIGLDADGLNLIQVARIRRTRWFTRDRAAFMEQLAVEIVAHVQRAIRHGLKPCVRLNGTSDLPWENIRCGGHANIFAMFPDVQFYDYTKVPPAIRLRVRRGLPAGQRAIPANYHLTFSLSEDNDTVAAAALIAGMNVAVPFAVKRGGTLPERYTIGRVTTAVIDGDKSDLRFLDTSGWVLGHIVGLRAKGARGKADTSGFIRNI